MSRGFVKEGDQEEVPIVPPRAFLPAGIPNYVTSGGMAALLKEKDDLTNQRDGYKERVERNYLNAKLSLLEERILTAKVIGNEQIPEDKVAFGTIVTLILGERSKPITVQITGVDEADITKGKISFVSPLSKGLSGHKAGESFSINLPNGPQKIHIISISRVTSV